jgi:hypothetical protein
VTSKDSPSSPGQPGIVGDPHGATEVTTTAAFEKFPTLEQLGLVGDPHGATKVTTTVASEESSSLGQPGIVGDPYGAPKIPGVRWEENARSIFLLSRDDYESSRSHAHLAGSPMPCTAAAASPETEGEAKDLEPTTSHLQHRGETTGGGEEMPVGLVATREEWDFFRRDYPDFVAVVLHLWGVIRDGPEMMEKELKVGRFAPKNRHLRRLHASWKQQYGVHDSTWTPDILLLRYIDVRLHVTDRLIQWMLERNADHAGALRAMHEARVMAELGAHWSTMDRLTQAQRRQREEKERHSAQQQREKEKSDGGWTDHFGLTLAVW